MKAPRHCKGCGNPLPVSRPTIPPQPFTRGYTRALDQGVDPLEALAAETDRLLGDEDRQVAA